MTDIRLVIMFLGVALLLCIGEIGYLAAQGLTIPDVLQNIAVGALASTGTVLTGRAIERRRQPPA